ncbi:MAG: hypothetical protein JHC61_16040 [Burkholderiaceae bacterium]|nr:hypothetical protein [Burkholderiaceae bacterium]
MFFRFAAVYAVRSSWLATVVAALSTTALGLAVSTATASSVPPAALPVEVGDRSSAQPAGRGALSAGADDAAAGLAWPEENASSCLDWHAEDLDVVEGRYEAYRDMPDVRWAMGSLPLGLGMVRTVIELRWRDIAAAPVDGSQNASVADSAAQGKMLTQTLFDAVSASEFAGGTSFYRSETGLHIDYPRCEWGAGTCDTASRHYRYSALAKQFVGADPASRDALLHLCPPGYFAVQVSKPAVSFGW